MKKEVKTRAEMEAFVAPLIEEDRYIIDIKEVVADGSFIIQWQEHKTYIAVDGKEFHDEVWTTENGDIIQVQDLSLDHAHNIIRMYLRNERKNLALLEALADQIMDDQDEDLSSDVVSSDEEIPENRVLH